MKIKIPKEIESEWNKYVEFKNLGLRKKSNIVLNEIIEKIKKNESPLIKEFLLSLCEAGLGKGKSCELIQYPLFVSCILPLLLNGLKNKSAIEIVYLVRSIDSGFTKEVYSILEEDYSIERLLKIALESEPNNKDVLNQLVYQYVDFLDWGSHHLPDGLIVDLTDANKTIDDCESLLEKNKEVISQKLITNFDYFTNLYKDYESWEISGCEIDFEQWCVLRNKNYDWCSTICYDEKS